MGTLLLKQYKKQCKMQMLLSGMEKRTREKVPVHLEHETAAHSIAENARLMVTDL
jgi:response regulator of citrate/malate metabolism